jgi:hypothetical protein
MAELDEPTLDQDWEAEASRFTERRDPDDDHFYGAWWSGGRQGGGRGGPVSRSQVMTAPAATLSPAIQARRAAQAQLAEQGLEAAAFWQSEEFRYLPVEHAVALDEWGKVVWKGTDNNRNQVQIKMDESATPAMLIHNHPSGSPFSYQDPLIVFTWSSLKELRVVTPNYTYKLKPGSQGWAGGMTNAEAQIFYKLVVENEWADVGTYKYRYNQEEMVRAFDLLWYNTANEMGWTYTKEPFSRAELMRQHRAGTLPMRPSSG